MKYEVEELRFKSSDGEHSVYAKIMKPIGKINGVVQICHGMNGYIGLYGELMAKLIEEGYAVCGHTSIGHWDSVNSKDELGFFGEFNGYKRLISDARKLTQIIKKKLPGQDIFLFGHSMGSFVARCYITKYSEDLAGAIFSGTCGPQPLIDSGIQFANLMVQKKGFKYRSRALYKALFQFANREIDNPKSDYDWVSKIARKRSDEKSDFLFTVTGLRDIVTLIKECNLPKEIEKINRDLPVYFFSGDEDPIGEYGSGLKRVIKLYQKSGLNCVSYKIYKGCRHECLSEPNKEEVMNDMIKWIKMHKRSKR